MRGAVLGVDGGGTKSHYVLADRDGVLIDFLEGGAGNHECHPDGFTGARRELETSIETLLSRNDLSPADIAASVFGMAGADVPVQEKTYGAILAKLGLRDSLVCNDAFLGVKAGSAEGYGLCSINGTGTSAAGIDPSGRRVQVGGLGFLSGDHAGAGTIAGLAVQSVYNELFRLGAATSMREPLLGLLGLAPGEAGRFAEALYAAGVPEGRLRDALVRLLFAEAGRGDTAALRVLEDCGREMALSAAGALGRLDFSSVPRVEVVIAGSVSLRGECPALLERFEGDLRHLAGRVLSFVRLDVPPVMGAVLWALEAAGEDHGRARHERLAEELRRALVSS